MAANERIEQHRKGDFVVTVTDAAGKPMAGATVELRQTKSHFHFGTCINGDPTSEKPDEVAYRKFITDHFNTLVCENHMKWYAVEKERDKITFERADAYMKFADEHGLAMRGHCLFWAKKKFVQEWLHDLEGEELLGQMDAHLNAIVPRYRGRLIAWDVNNEMLDGHFYKDKLGDDIRPWMFKRAAELDPDTPLFVNDYAILGHGPRTKEFIEQIKGLQKAGAQIGGIGIQEHACERIILDPKEAEDRPERKYNVRVTPDEMYATLDELAEFDLPIHLTEISSKHTDENVRADALEALFRVGFSHAKVESIMLWGFWARRHWLGRDAALVNPDWTLTESGKRLSKMLLEEWRTNTQVKPDSAGRVSFRGFYGDYDVIIRDADGNELKGTVSLTPGELSATVKLK
jgi:GH35 family endo-1,4-beta-xylanase